jgi:hypothetical protein
MVDPILVGRKRQIYHACSWIISTLIRLQRIRFLSWQLSSGQHQMQFCFNSTGPKALLQNMRAGEEYDV